MKFSREAMTIASNRFVKELLDICKKNNDIVEINQVPTDRFKRQCKYRGLKIKVIK